MNDDRDDLSSFTPVFTNVTLGGILNHLSRVISLSSASLLHEVPGLVVPAPPACIRTGIPTVDCEETPSYLCDNFDGCWVSWGPCQHVSEGFYSPPGTTNQVPCPPIPDNQRYVEGDSSSVCATLCTNSSDVKVNSICRSVPAGFTAVQSCDTTYRLYGCPDRYGTMYFQECAARYLAVALGAPRSVMIPFTVQSWIRINSRAVSSGDGMVSVYGSFGSSFIGIKVESDTIRLVLLIALDEFVGTLVSDSVPHLRSEWDHIAATVTDSRVRFYLNGNPIGESAISTLSVRSSPFLLQSLLTESASRQLQPYLNIEHFGPFRLTGDDIAASSFWDAYKLTSFPDMDLFDPHFLNRSINWCNLGYYGSRPDGPVTAAENCTQAAVWNSSSCECEDVIVSTTELPTTISTDPCVVSSLVATSSAGITRSSGTQPMSSTTEHSSSTSSATMTAMSVTICETTTAVPETNSTSTSIGMVILCVLISAFGLLVWRRRRVNRIANRAAVESTEIHAIPHPYWLTDVTADWQIYSHN